MRGVGTPKHREGVLAERLDERIGGWRRQEGWCPMTDGLTGVGLSPPLPLWSILVNSGVHVCSEEPSRTQQSPRGRSGM